MMLGSTFGRAKVELDSMSKIISVRSFFIDFAKLIEFVDEEAKFTLILEKYSYGLAVDFNF